MLPNLAALRIGVAPTDLPDVLLAKVLKSTGRSVHSLCAAVDALQKTSTAGRDMTAWQDIAAAWGMPGAPIPPQTWREFVIMWCRRVWPTQVIQGLSTTHTHSMVQTIAANNFAEFRWYAANFAEAHDANQIAHAAEQCLAELMNTTLVNGTMQMGRNPVPWLEIAWQWTRPLPGHLVLKLRLLHDMIRKNQLAGAAWVFGACLAGAMGAPPAGEAYAGLPNVSTRGELRRVIRSRAYQSMYNFLQFPVQRSQMFMTLSDVAAPEESTKTFLIIRCIHSQ
jgi:hypothetical protein